MRAQAIDGRSRAESSAPRVGQGDRRATASACGIDGDAAAAVVVAVAAHGSVAVYVSVRRDRLRRSYARRPGRRHGGRVLPGSRTPRNKGCEACQGRVDDDGEQEEGNYQGVNAGHGELLIWKEWDSSGTWQRRCRRHDPSARRPADGLVLTLGRQTSTAGSSRRRPILSASRRRTSGFGQSGRRRWRHCLVLSASHIRAGGALGIWAKAQEADQGPVAGRTSSQMQEGGARSTLRRSTSRPRMPRAISLSSNANSVAPEGT